MGSISILDHLLIVATTTKNLTLSSWHLLMQIINSYLSILDVMVICPKEAYFVGHIIQHDELLIIWVSFVRAGSCKTAMLTFSMMNY